MGLTPGVDRKRRWRRLCTVARGSANVTRASRLSGLQRRINRRRDEGGGELPRFLTVAVTLLVSCLSLIIIIIGCFVVKSTRKLARAMPLLPTSRANVGVPRVTRAVRLDS